MSNCPNNLKYTKSHEWIKIDGKEATIGITDHAQCQLGDLVYVELPLLADEVFANKEAAVVESVKTAADVYSPLTGKVSSVNESLTAQPEILNEDPYDKGWLFKIEIQNDVELTGFMTAEEYSQTISD